MRFVYVLQALRLQHAKFLTKFAEMLAEMCVAQAFYNILRQLRLALLYTVFLYLWLNPFSRDLRSREQERELSLHEWVGRSVKVIADELGIAKTYRQRKGLGEFVLLTVDSVCCAQKSAVVWRREQAHTAERMLMLRTT